MHPWTLRFLAWACVVIAACCPRSISAQGKDPVFPSVGAAIEALGADEFDTRQRASEFLWRAGNNALPALEQAAKTTDPEVRLRATLVLRKVRLGITPDTPPALQALISQFYDGDRNTRQRVINELRQQAAFKTLFALLQTETDKTSRQLFFSTLQADVQRLAPQMVAGGDWSLLEQWLDLGKATDAGRAPFAAYALLRGKLPEELTKAQAELAKNKADPGAALLVATLLRAGGERAKALKIAASVNAPATLLLQGLSREQSDWPRLLGFYAEKGANPSAELHRLATRGLVYRMMGDAKQADNAFQQLIAQAPSADVWFASKALLLNDRPQEALELLRPGLRPMAFELLMQRQDHAAALELAGIKDDTKFDAAWLNTLTGQQAVRTSRTVDRLAFAVNIAGELRLLGKQKQFDELHALLITTATTDDSRGVYWQQIARLERQPGRQRQLLEMHGRGAEKNQQASLSALFAKKYQRAQIWWEALDGDIQWQEPKSRLNVVAVAMQPAIYARHVEVDWPAVARHVAAKARDVALPSPYRARLHVALAEAWGARGDKAKANEHWQAACAADAVSSMDYGDSLLAEQRWPEAAAQYQRVVDLNQGNALAWFLNGVALIKAGQGEAGRKLQNTANLMCLDSTARYTLALAIQDRNLRDEAREQWTLLQLTGQPDDQFVTIANQYLGNLIAEKEPLAAAQHWEQLRYHLLKPTTNLIEQNGYLDLALSLYRTRARGLLAKGDHQGALADLALSQQLLPGHIKLVEEFTPLLRQAGLEQEADKLFENTFQTYAAAVKQFPNSAALHNQAAWTAAIAGRRLDEALTLGNEAVKLAPESASYIDTLAEVYFARGDREQALVWARKAAAVDLDSKFHEERLQGFTTRELPKGK